MISARILADSVNPAGSRLTTWLLTYPRIIHAEMMTHRVFSRNAASSRAIPFGKMMEAVEEDSNVIEYWSSEQKGMQGGEELASSDLAQLIWEKAAGGALGYAKALHDKGVHKSICNRLLEPFGHITVIATATDHSNFFQLRASPMAQPEFQVLAFRMLHEYLKSEPIPLEWEQWHIPKFNGVEEKLEPLPIELELKVATARCARVSYTTHEREYSLEDQVALHDRLAASGHFSPFEHCAKAVNPWAGIRPWNFSNPEYQPSNFDQGKWFGFMQYRKTLDNECARGYTQSQLQTLYDQKPDWIKPA